MNSRAYFRSVQETVLAANHVIRSDLAFDEISESECYIRGFLTLTGGYELYVAEYVITEPEFKRLKYHYHLQTSGKDLVVRWDNANHHTEVDTFLPIIYTLPMIL